MYESIGVNLSKRIDNLTKRVKVPAVTQREYYKEDSDTDFIKFYGEEDFDENLKEDEPIYLDEDYDNEEDDECCYDSCCNLDKKNIALISIGAVVGVLGLYLLIKRK